MAIFSLLAYFVKIPVCSELCPPFGSLCEYNRHERLKSSLAFRWPGMAVVSGRMARADGVYISLERPGLPGAGRSPGSAGGGSWLAHRSRIMLGVRDGYQNDAGMYHHESRAMPDCWFGHSVDGTECPKQQSRGCVIQGWYASASKRLSSTQNTASS